MDILLLMVFLVGLAFICEYIDSSLGMGYGTILSPLLIIFGFPALAVIPSILISQAAGGFLASIFHHKKGNVCFKRKSRDSKIVYVIMTGGVAATILAAFIATNISKNALNTYIGIMVLVVGIVILSKHIFKFSWKKMICVGLISSFNKGISGGGFGPVVTGGQIIAGNQNRSSIGCTTLAEAPICIAAFITYVLLKGVPPINLFIPLLIGAIIAAPLGPLLTFKLDQKVLRPMLGMFITILGLWVLAKVFLF